MEGRTLRITPLQRLRPDQDGEPPEAESHVYQPLLIRTLLDAGGSATLRQAGIAFVSQERVTDPRAEPWMSC